MLGGGLAVVAVAVAGAVADAAAVVAVVVVVVVVVDVIVLVVDVIVGWFWRALKSFSNRKRHGECSLRVPLREPVVPSCHRAWVMCQKPF